MEKKQKKEIELSLKGQKNSKNRDSVISVLINSHAPVSVEDIFLQIKAQNNKISLSTVYRIIDKLAGLNIVQEASRQDDKALYELVQKGHHHYIICTKCKKMTMLDNCPIAELEQKISQDTGFFITGHKYEVYGECRECRKNQQKF